MVLHDVYDLFDYWRDCPPSHLLLRAYVGYKPPDSKPASNQGFEAFFSAMTGRAP